MELKLLFYSPNWDKMPDVKAVYEEANMDGVVEWDGQNLTGPETFIDMTLNMTRGRHKTDPSMIEEAMRFAPFRIRNAYRWCVLEGAEPEVPDAPPWQRWDELTAEEEGQREDAKAPAATSKAAPEAEGGDVTLRPYPTPPDPTEGRNEFTLVDKDGDVAAKVTLEGDEVIIIDGPKTDELKAIIGLERAVMGGGGEGVDADGNVVMLYDGQVTLPPMTRANFADVWAAPLAFGFQRCDANEGEDEDDAEDKAPVE